MTAPWLRLKVRTLLVAIALAALIAALNVEARERSRLKWQLRDSEARRFRLQVKLLDVEETNRRLRYQLEVLGFPQLQSQPIVRRRLGAGTR